MIVKSHHIPVSKSLYAKRILRSSRSKKILITIGLMLMSPFIYYALPVEEESIIYQYPLPNENRQFDDLIGWYQSSENKMYELTWSANSDIMLNHYDSIRANNKSYLFRQIDVNNFDMDKDSLTSELNILREGDLLKLVLNLPKSETRLELTKIAMGPYTTKEVAYYNGEVKLTGSLLIPEDTNERVGIVMIHGSGDSDRDSFWYQYQAHYLASEGFHVLLPDKRGCGRSMGTWHDASFSDFAGDALAGVEFMKADRMLNIDKIGLMGISQGAWVSHLVASKTDKIDFVVDVVGSVQTPRKQLSYEVKNDIGLGFFSAVIAPFVTHRVRKKRPIWWEKNGDFDPIPLMAGSTVPVLKISAENDKNVNTKKSIRYVEALQSENPDLPLEIKIIKDASHTLFHLETQWMSHEYLSFLVSWLKERN
ncbi:alpha/beta fold hydrolase [Aureisphaera galaxeae]|uniref:alpha/beta hydrolase family protein n=1 Tax=Aureisphaera galaxeae TaxID=1538023 RepID=UPI002350617B|nr:alpha/beta fold hydrolase [Aureisphaera galaxeae]MDC8005696.1 alpha/beta fold hydrolase [Aureisphaera galaxeae]